MPSPYDQTGYIAGQLPPMGPAGAIGGSPGDIQAGYQTAYNSALGQNTANYQNILAGYQQTAAGQRTAQDAIAAGYPQLAGRIQDQLGGVSQQHGQAGQQNVAGYGGVNNQVQGYLGWMGSGGLADQYSRHSYISGQYDQLQQQTLGDIAMAGQEGQRQINDQYAQGSANAYNSAVGRGLGNTTVQDSLQRGVEFDRARAQANLQEGIGNLRAGYRSQLGQAGLGYQREAAQTELGQQNLISQSMANAAGQYGQAGLQAGERFATAQAGIGQQAAGYAAGIGQAGLGYRGQAAMNNTNLAMNQLGWMNSVNAPYPNAGAYMQAAQMSGAAQAAQAAQDAFRRQQAGMGGGVNTGGMQMVPGTGRGVPSLGSYGQPAPGMGDVGGGGGYFQAQHLNAGIGAGPARDAFGNQGFAIQPAEQAALDQEDFGYDPQQSGYGDTGYGYVPGAGGGYGGGSLPEGLDLLAAYGYEGTG